MTHEAEARAVWFRREHRTRCELFDSEQDAAGFAVRLDKEGHGAALGVQFPDGRVLKVGEWPAYAERRRQWEAVERSESGSAVDHLPTRPVRDPFGGEVVEIGAFDPAWLGRELS